MKILVATKESNGKRPGDFYFAEELEIVYVGDCDHLNEDCGCNRSMVGVRSGKGTTTMLVMESDMTPEEFRKEIIKANREFIEMGVPEGEFIEQADALLELAKEFPHGAVIERNGEDFEPREFTSH